MPAGGILQSARIAHTTHIADSLYIRRMVRVLRHFQHANISCMCQK